MVDLVSIGEPMLEFNQQPGTDAETAALGRRFYLEGFGGDTSNAAIAAARAGCRVAYVTAIGDDPAGDRFAELWTAEGIDMSGVRLSNTHPTAVYFVTHGPRGHEFRYYRQGSAASTMSPVDMPKSLIENAKFVFASGVSQAISPNAADAVFHAFDLARAAGVKVAYDTNYRARLWPVPRARAVMHHAVAMADIALPSLEDAQMLTGLNDPAAIVDFYLRLGPKLVVLKLGDKGARLGTPDGHVDIPPFPCRFIDGTGAGDTFCGNFLARLIAGDQPADAARYAGVAAALKTEGFGAVAAMPHEPVVRAAMATT
jgi:2-dehydro-3-deoxygluconokinase